MQKFILSVLLFFILFLNNPATAAVGNGGFETGTASSWNLGPPAGQGGHSIHADYAYSGNYGCQLTITPGNRIYFYQNVDLTGKNYLSFRFKAVSLPGYSEFFVKVNGIERYSTTSTSGSYTHVFIDVSEQSGSDQVVFELWNGTGEIWVDDWSVDQSPPTHSINYNPSSATSFTDPENIQLDTTVGDYDSGEYIYTVRLYGYSYGGWGALTQVEYNESTKIETYNKSIIADIDSSWYDLPLYIKGVILQFNKGDYTTTEVAETSTLYYNPYSGPTSGGTVNFNQSYYNDPETVGVEYTITNIDTGNYTYYIEVVGSETGNTWTGVNDEYIEIEDEDGQKNYTINHQWMELPINIKAVLYLYDSTTGISYELDESNEAIYNPASVAPGSVWTNKESYNTTEIVTIYTNTENGGKLKVDKRDDSLYDWYNIYSGLSNIKFAVQTSYVGIWDVCLYEEDTNGNYVVTNQTVFTVLADEDVAYFNWWETPIYKGVPASYDYIATSNNSIVRIYDGTGNKLYEFNATEGYNTGQITTTTGTVGNWTGSLYDNGTYYNASLEVEGSYSWVRFDRTDYYLEDTIQIEYFIVSQDHAIVLRDADNKIVLKWMPGTFMTGQRGTLDYTLIEDNEWNHDVQTQLWNGYITAGLWYVGYEDINYLVGYPDSYDEATVHNCYDYDQIGGGGGAAGDGSLIGELTSIAELAGFRGEVGLFILSILIIIIASAAMLISKFPVQGVLCIDILLFFAFIGIGFIPILYLILFGVVAGLIVFGTIFFRKAG